MIKKYIAIAIIGSFFLNACVSFKQQAIFDYPSSQLPPEGIEGFYGLSIFDDNITGEIWFTENKPCLEVIHVKDKFHSGNASMYWKWNKSAGGCPWLGIGFGWDAWSPKDISGILDKAAIEFKIRTVEGRLNSLPLAAAFEDYSGLQAWLGFSSKTIQAKKLSEEWSSVILPLSEFNWQENGASAENIKQLIVQFEAEGDIYVDDIRIIPFEGGFKKRLYAGLFQQAEINVDGKDLEEIWNAVKPIDFDNNRIKLISDNKNLYVFAEILDKDPLQNKQEDGSIWNGDAFEMAFSTDPELSSRRIRFKSTDQHIGIRINENPITWNWRKEKPVEAANTVITKTEKGYTMEAQIPLKEFNINAFKIGKKYGIEFAIDQGNESGKRISQKRWNSPEANGYNSNPSLWGDLIFKEIPVE